MANAVRRVTQKAQFLLIEKSWLVYGIFLLGIFIRIYDLDEKSLWFDEAWVANLASSDNLSAAFFNLHHTPPLFLSSLFVSVHLFGNNEWYLRIVPALFSIGGMALIYHLVRDWLGKAAGLGALLLFSIHPVVMAYSKELKQYTGDIFFVLLLIYISERLLLRRENHLWIVLAIAGSVGIWFSYPVAFALFSIGIVLLWNILHEDRNSSGRHRRLFYLSMTLISILVSLILFYFLIVRLQMFNVDFSKSLDSFWNTAFPDTTGIGAFITWFGLNSWSFMPYFWNEYAPAALFFSLAGIWELYRSGRSRVLLYWGLIFLSLLTASFLHIFPFGALRVTIFTIPFFIIVFISGIKAFYVRIGTKAVFKPLAYFGFLLLVIMVIDAAIYYKNDRGKLWHVQYPQKEDMRLLLHSLDKERKEGEAVYVYYGAGHAYKYYSEHYFKKSYSPIIMGKSHRFKDEKYISELKPFIDRRKPFWFLGTHYSRHEINYIQNAMITEWNYYSHLFVLTRGEVLIYYFPNL